MPAPGTTLLGRTGAVSRVLPRPLVAVALLASVVATIVANEPTTASAQSPSCGATIPNLANGGFELPAHPANGLTQQSTPNTELVWQNTAENQIEMWHQVFESTSAYEGSQFVELNSTRPGTLYQDLTTVPSTQMVFAFAHKARVRDGETVVVLAGPPGGALVQVGRFPANKQGPARNGWTLHQGTYDVPVGQSTTRFAFRSDGTTTVDASTGNLLDDVRFTLVAGACDDRRPPIASGGSTTAAVVSNDIGTGLRLTSVGAPAPQGSGTATMVGDQVTFASTRGFSGPVTVPYTVTDFAGQASTANVLVTVHPVATADAIAVTQNSPVGLDVLANDLGSGLTITQVGAPTHGTATVAGNRVAYTPPPNYSGQDSFTYTIAGAGDSAAPSSALRTTVTLTVRSAADLSIAQDPVVPSVVRRGEVFSYRLTVTNLGPSTALSPGVRFTLPAGFSLVGGTDCSAGPPAQCVLPATSGGLAVGASTTFDPLLRADTDGPGFALVATAVTTTVDPFPANDSVTQTLDIKPVADLRAGPGSVGAAVPGTPVTWQVPITNDGPSISSAATVRLGYPDADIAPASVTVSVGGATVTCAAAGTGLIDCPLGDIAAGATVTVSATGDVDPSANAASLTFSARASSVTEDSDPTNNAAVWSAGTTPQADLVVSGSLVSPSPLDPGGTATFEFEVANKGPSDAVATYLVLDLPAGLTVVGAPASCTVAATRVTCALNDLAPGASSGPLLVATEIAARVPGDVPVTATASSATPDPTPADNAVTVAAPVDRRADLAVVLGVTPNPGAPGGPAVLVASVFNGGPSTATGVTATFDLPLLFVGPSTTVPAGCTRVAQTVTCPIGVLGNGGSAEFIIRSTWDPSASSAPPGFSFSGAVTSTGPRDPDTANNTATTSVPVSPVADLSVSGTVSPRPLVPGAAAFVSLTVRNDGPSATPTGSKLVVDLPAGVSLGAPLPTGCADTGTTGMQQATCNLSALAAGAQLGVVIPVDVDPSFSGTASFTATVTPPAGIPDPDPSNDSVTLTDDSLATADLAVRAVATPVDAVAGLTGAATFRIANNGPSDAPDAPFVLAVPAGWASQGISGATCAPTADPSRLECHAGPLKAGTELTVTATVAVPAGASGSAAVTVTTTGGFGGAPVLDDPDPANNSADVTLRVVGATDLAVTGSPPAGAVRGAPVDWGFAVTNIGPSVARAGTLTVDLATGLRFRSAAGASCTAAGQTVACTLPDVGVAGVALVAITTDVATDAPAALTLTARVGGADFDPDASNNTDASSTPVTGPPTIQAPTTQPPTTQPPTTQPSSGGGAGSASALSAGGSAATGTTMAATGAGRVMVLLALGVALALVGLAVVALGRSRRAAAG
jgi:uncharacterized repeat protein (TIGR01451 family)